MNMMETTGNPHPDRTQAPPVRPVEEIGWKPPQEHLMPGGKICYYLPDTTMEAVRIDLLFPGGSWTEEKPLTAEAVIHTLREGTASRDAATIAEIFEYYGGYVVPFSHRDHTGLSLYTLRRHAPPLLELLEEIVREPRFPEREIHTWLQQEQQAFLIEREKVSFLAHAAFLETLYGPDHPYGRQRKEEDYRAVTPADLAQWHRQNLSCDRCHLIVAGSTDDELLSLLDRHFPPAAPTTSPSTLSFPAPPPTPGEQEIHIPKENTLQAAIVLGKRTINRDHPDFPALAFTVTLLGGYFGSRLMKNIREEKGYTYGISASLRPLREDAYLAIQTEAGSAYCGATMEEIIKEIERLRKDLPPGEEMMLVRNYMMGQLLQSLDGVLSRAEVVKRYLSAKRPFSLLERFAKEVRAMTAEKVRETARRYLDPGTLIRVVAGNCDS